MTENEEVQKAIAKQLCAWNFWTNVNQSQSQIDNCWPKPDMGREFYLEKADAILKCHPLLAVLASEQDGLQIVQTLECHWADSHKAECLISQGWRKTVS